MKYKKSNMTIGMSILLILLSVLLCIFTFHTINKVFFVASVNQATETMQVIRGLGIHLVDNKLRGLKEKLEETASVFSSQIAEGTPEQKAAVLAQMQLPEDGINYWIATPDGRAVDSEGKQQNWENELDLKPVFLNHKTAVLDPYFNEEGSYVFSIAAPLQKNNQTVALLVVRMNGFCISRWLEDIQFQTGEGVAYIITGEGRNIAASREENYDWITSMYNSQKIAYADEESRTVAELERQPLEGKTGSGSYLWEGSRNYLVYAPMAETDWGFFVGFYGDLMNNYIKESALKSIISSVPFFGAILLFFIFLIAYANYNLRKEKKYVGELLYQKQEIQKQAEDIKVNEERFRVALAQTNNTIFEYNPQTGGITNFYSTKVRQISDSLEDLKEQFITQGVIDDESLEELHKMLNDTRSGICDNECTIKVIYPNETAAWYKVSISPLSKQKIRIIGIIENITKEKQGELDSLTGHLNKKVFKEQIVSYLNVMKAETIYALLIFDIDNFKNVNDNFGHPMGDQVIIQTGKLLKKESYHNALVGRIGGDEFCVFCYNITSVEKLKEDLDRFYSQPHFMGEGISVTYSCGVVFGCGMEHNTYDELYESADSALYQAKQQGKNQYCIYSKNKADKKRNE